MTHKNATIHRDRDRSREKQHHQQIMENVFVNHITMIYSRYDTEKKDTVYVGEQEQN